MRAHLVAIVAALTGATLVVGLKAQQQPVFRGGTEVVQLDVSVLDKNRRPVRGLAQADFTVLEDGKPQRIVAFDAVDVPDAVPPTATWMTRVTPDVTTNDLEERRLFVIVMDDALVPFEPRMMKDAKAIAARIIEKLGAHDLACIVFTADNRNTQDFTSDHAKLLAALERFHPGLATYQFGRGGGEYMGIDTDSNFFQSTVSTLHNVADYLIEIPQRRKTLVYVGPGVPVDVEAAATPTLASGTGKGLSDKMIAERLAAEMNDIFRAAQRANVNISSIDPTGPGGLEQYISSQIREIPPGETAHAKAKLSLDFLEMTAANTGGHAVVNTGDFEPGITQIFEENGSYYLLGFQPATMRTDGSLRRLDVKVNRPDVEVRSRSGYYAPKTDAPKPGKTPPSPLAKAISGMLPNADLPMAVTLAPFVTPGSRDTTVAIVLGLEQELIGPAKGKVTETVELQTSAFSPDGSNRGSQRQNAQVVLRDGASGLVRYEMLSKIDLKPGRYELRLAAHHTNLDKSGSVYADVEVPDFMKAPLSLSGAVLNLTPSLASAPKDGLAAVLPFAPTAERAFLVSQKVLAFLRAYQSHDRARIPVQLAIRIVDAHDRAVVSETQTLGADRFGVVERAVEPAAPTAPVGRGGGFGRAPSAPATPAADPGPWAADIRYQVPLDRLGPGPHVLTFEATAAGITTSRSIRFVVR